MRAEFFRPDSPDRAVGEAIWNGTGVDVTSEQQEVLVALRRIFRPVPVAIDDPALLPPGSSGPTVLQPGALNWFMAAARARSKQEGLGVRLHAPVQGAMGWDPAGVYRPFNEQIERKVRTAAARPDGAQAGEVRAEGESGPSAAGTEAAKPAPGQSAAGPSEAGLQR